MKPFFAIVLLMFCLEVRAAIEPEGQLKGQTRQKVILGIVHRSSKLTFDSEVFPLVQKHLARCSNCEILNLTPYDDKGLFDSSKLHDVFQKEAKQTQVLLLSWNERVNDANRSWLEALAKLSEAGTVIVAPAGSPREAEASAPLTRTLLGQIPNALIIGELEERDRLKTFSFFGPEMLTALRPPKEYQGKGYSSLLFATRLASKYGKHSDWPNHLKDKKNKSRKLWMDLDDLFGRE